MMELVIAVLGALTVSALCSLFEAVLYSVPASHIEAMAQSGRRAGHILSRLRQDVDRPIAAILSLNTIANTAGASVAGAAAAKVFGSVWVGYFSAAFTLAVLILAEVIPKTAGVVYSKPLASLIARPLDLLVTALRPLIWVCSLTTRMISRQAPDPADSALELITMARLGLRTGGIEAHQAEVIQNILSLEHRKVSDIITPGAVIMSFPLDMTVQQAYDRHGVPRFSRIPVFAESGNIAGIVHRRTLLESLATAPERTVADLLHPVPTVAGTMSLEQLLMHFYDSHTHIAMVDDGSGGLAGVVTFEDVLEAIIGREIVDELNDVPGVRARAPEQQHIEPPQVSPEANPPRKRTDP